MLLEKGLIKGGSLNNAILLDETGIVNEEELRYPDEFVRHKVLDLLGDFSLAGAPITGKIYAEKSGHSMNIEITKIIKKEFFT